MRLLYKHIFLLVGLCFLLLLLPASIHAATYYIDATDGNNSNNGTSAETAWKDLSKASSSPVTSGDTILLQRGETWTGQTLAPAAGTTIDVYGSGAKPIIDGNSAVARSISLVANNASVSNIAVKGATSSMVFVGATGITLNDIDSTGNPIAYRINSGTATLNRVTSSGASNAAFFFENSSVTTINTATSTTTTTGNGFRIIGSATVTCNDCTASASVVDGFSLANTSTLTCNRCKAFNNGSTGDSTSGDGFTSHDTSTMNVRYSIAYGNYKAGVAVTGGSSGEVLNSSFYNNVQSTHGSGWDSSSDLGIGINATGTWTIKNNITQGHPVEFMISAVAVSGGVSVTSDYNLFYDSLGSNAFDYNGTFSNFTTYKSNSGKDSNSLNVNPLFRDASGANFLLQPSSPAINAGTSVSLTTDYAGNSVPQGTAPDMGAYEFLVPSTASSLAQYGSDGSTAISTGGTSSSTSVVLKFNMSSSNTTDSLTPQVEVQPISTSFTNSSTHSGSSVSYSGTAVEGTVTVTGLTDGTSYHWQARLSNAAGQGSWTSYGGNSESAADFVIVVPTATPTPTSTPIPAPAQSSGTKAPSCIDGFTYCSDIGPNAVGKQNTFISGFGSTALVQLFIPSGATPHDLYIDFKKIAIEDMYTNIQNVIPLPWSQGLNTAGDIFKITPLSAFNGYPVVDFIAPGIVILPFDATVLATQKIPASSLRIAVYNPASHKWEVLENDTVVDWNNQTLANITSRYGYFTIVYKTPRYAIANSNILSQMPKKKSLDTMQLTKTEIKDTLTKWPQQGTKVVEEPKVKNQADQVFSFISKLISPITHLL